MGDIIAFDLNARRTRKSGTLPAGGDAQILFFLGVRYMRMDDAMVERLQRQSSGRDKPSGGGRRRRRA